MTSMTCAELRDVAGEVALTLLTGAERAAALAHLETCQACRTEVADLTATADELLLLAPAAEPPAGFESRVLAAMAESRPAAAMTSLEPSLRPVPL